MKKIYTSGDWILDTNNGSLCSIEGKKENQDQNITLEPRVMRLLVYLLDHPLITISRDELITNIWDGATVSESAINWTIAQLRKSLKDKQTPKRYIQTLSKQGYLWREKVEFSYPEREYPSKIRNEKTRVTTATDHLTLKAILSEYRRSIFLIALLIVTYIIFLLTQKAQEYSQLEGFSYPFTAMAGREEQPTFSPDGRWLAFAHQDSQVTQNARLMIKATKEEIEFLSYNSENKANTKTHPSIRQVPERELVKTNGFIRTISWAPHSKQLVYLQYDDGKCEIMLLRLNVEMQVISNELVHQCSRTGYSHVSWGTESNAFYFTDAINDNPYQIYRYDLTTKESKLFGPKNEKEIDSYLIRVSPTKMEAIVLEHVRGNISNFYLVNLKTKEKQILFSALGIFHDIDWNKDGTAIFYNENQHNIHRYDIETKEFSKLLFGGNSEIYSIVESPTEALFAYVSTSTNHSRIDSVKIGESIDEKFDPKRIDQLNFTIDSSYNEWSPLITTDGKTVYFLSNRTRLEQVWRREQDGTERQLSNITSNLKLSSINLSSDNSILIGKANSQIHAMDLVKETSFVFNGKNEEVANPIFVQDDKSIVFAKLIDQKWQLVKVPYQRKIVAPEILTTEGGYFPVSITKSKIYYSRRNECGLWSYDLLTLDHKKVTAKVCISSSSSRFIEGSLFYEDFKSPTKGIYRWDENKDLAVLIYDREMNSGVGFSIDSNLTTLVVNRTNQNNADIQLIRN